jgi:hypothetical protein
MFIGLVGPGVLAARHDDDGSGLVVASRAARTLLDDSSDAAAEKVTADLDATAADEGFRLHVRIVNWW